MRIGSNCLRLHREGSIRRRRGGIGDGTGERRCTSLFSPMDLCNGWCGLSRGCIDSSRALSLFAVQLEWSRSWGKESYDCGPRGAARSETHLCSSFHFLLFFLLRRISHWKEKITSTLWCCLMFVLLAVEVVAVANECNHGFEIWNVGTGNGITVTVLW